MSLSGRSQDFLCETPIEICIRTDFDICAKCHFRGSAMYAPVNNYYVILTTTAYADTNTCRQYAQNVLNDFSSLQLIKLFFISFCTHAFLYWVHGFPRYILRISNGKIAMENIKRVMNGSFQNRTLCNIGI